MSYSFRVRCRFPPTDKLNVEGNRYVLGLNDADIEIELRSIEPNTELKRACDAAFVASGFDSDESARAFGLEWIAHLKRASARCRFALDFGDRSPTALIFDSGLKWLEQKWGQRVVHDPKGLSVYVTNPPPRFARVSNPSISRGIPIERFESALVQVLARPRELSRAECLAYQLYADSFFAGSADARFLSLMIAVEALITLEPRPDESREHVEVLILLTTENDQLSKNEKQSMIGALRWLQNESINQAGRRLVTGLLGSRTYGHRKASRFFTDCYSLRSRLVHGSDEFPSRETIGSAAGQLELMVADLLAADLLDVTVD